MQDAIFSSAGKTGKLDFFGRNLSKKYKDEPQQFRNKVLWTEERKLDLYQTDEKVNV